MSNPYEIIKAFSTKEWNNVKDRDKAKNFFMVNRIMSINFPLQANSFNNIKIQPEKVVDFWKVFISNYYKKSPPWIWTKTQKGEKESTTYEYKEDVISFMKEKYQISNREIKELKQFFPKKFHLFYKEIEKILN